MAEGKRWDIRVCDHCGQNVEENWRCGHGLCDRTDDGKAVEPSESLVEIMPVSEHEAALAKAHTEGKRLAVAVADYATGRFGEEMATGSVVPDGELRELCALADSLTKEGTDG